MNGVRRAVHFLITGLITLVAAASVSAAEWYQVEVMAFRYKVEENSAWSPAPAVPDFAGALRLVPAPEHSAPGVPVAWQTLPAHELKLAGARQALARTGRVDPLFHTGWRQPAGEGRPVYLSSPAETAVAGAAPRPFVEGAVRLTPAGRGFRLDSRFVAHTVEASILLGESRAMVTGDLHYLDHPLVGVIVQVTANEVPGENSHTPATGALPLNPAPQTPGVAPPR